MQEYACRKLGTEQDLAMSITLISSMVQSKTDPKVDQNVAIDIARYLAAKCAAGKADTDPIATTTSYNAARDFHRVKWNAEIIDPPTNCRAEARKDSEVLQLIQDREFVKVSKPLGEWHLEMNRNCWIHVSQFRAIDPVFSESPPSVTPDQGSLQPVEQQRNSNQIPVFRNCKEAKANGYSNIDVSQHPEYASKDRDKDGIACES